jgi:hypothetical protein
VTSEPPLPQPLALLLRAVRTLPESDQDSVMAWLLTRPAPLGPPPPEASPGWSSGPLLSATARLESIIGPQEPLRGQQQLVPVRLSLAQHARLREWCQEHGFSMATVVRGLVSRFLDDVEPHGRRT